MFCNKVYNRYCAPNGRTTYRITVLTDDCRFAGTDANVFVTLHGASGASSGPGLGSAAFVPWACPKMHFFSIFRPGRFAVRGRLTI